MKSLRAILMAVGLLYGASELLLPCAEVNFKVTDIPGHCLRCGQWNIQGQATRSLGLVTPRHPKQVTVHFTQNVAAKGCGKQAHRHQPGVAVDRPAGETDGTMLQRIRKIMTSP